MKMKNLFICSCLLIATISTASYISGCKKDDNNSKKLIDEITGTYIAYDTLRYTPQDSCGGDIYNTFSFTISKQSETAVKISTLGTFCNNADANVSENNITLLTSSCSNYSPTVTRAGVNLYFTYSDFFMGTGVSCNGEGTIKAVKQ